MATTASTSCQNIPVSKISASGSSTGYPPSNARDANLNTRWAHQGLGSWLQADLGVKMTICSLDIAWYRGNIMQYNFVISVSDDGSSFTNVFSGKSGKTSSFQTYTLPSDTNGRYVRITVNGNTKNSLASILELGVNGYQSSTTPPPANLYDDFEGSGTYTLEDGQTSPNGKWLDIYNGYGSSGVKDDGTGSGNKVFFMYPKTSTSLSQTQASLTISKQTWSDFDSSIDVKTVKQLRQNNPPNEWETAWIFFRYTDTFHYYAFLIKPNEGIEFDKKDCNTCTDPIQGQQFLVTTASPTLKIGAWSNWKVSAIGNHFIITVDGNKVVDYIDQNMSPKLASGSIAMYNEDASAQFDNVYVTPR
jgi:F5/8 type C domain/3-keto-disaccharide hydrolase